MENIMDSRIEQYEVKMSKSVDSLAEDFAGI